MWKLLIVYGCFMLSSYERQKEHLERTDVVSTVSALLLLYCIFGDFDDSYKL
jgi:hypothetical protein